MIYFNFLPQGTLRMCRERKLKRELSTIVFMLAGFILLLRGVRGVFAIKISFLPAPFFIR